MNIPITCQPKLQNKIYQYYSWNNRSKFKWWDFGCYSVTDFGKEPKIWNARFCDEHYNKDGSVKEIHCPEIKFKPNGWYHKVEWSSSLANNPEDDYKDSLSITVGKCAKIN